MCKLGDGKVEMGIVRADKPLDLLCIDVLTVDKSTDGMENILVITDCYAKFSKAILTWDQLAITVAKLLTNEWFFHFGIPNRIHSDMGRNFMSAVVKELCSSFGIKCSTTIPTILWVMVNSKGSHYWGWLERYLGDSSPMFNILNTYHDNSPIVMFQQHFRIHEIYV